LNAGRLVFDGGTDQALSHYYKLFREDKPHDLSERIDRQGRGRGRFIDAWIEDGVGTRTETVITGQQVRFVLRIRNMGDKPLTSLSAGIGIFSLNNQFLASASTVEARIPTFDVDRECLVTLEIPRFTLNQGQYYFNAVLRSASGVFEYDDLIENVAAFSVDYGDFHGIGQSSGGLLSIEHKARIEEVEEGDQHSRPVKAAV
jgi:hypothetical protein